MPNISGRVPNRDGGAGTCVCTVPSRGEFLSCCVLDSSFLLQLQSAVGQMSTIALPWLLEVIGLSFMGVV